MKSNIFKFALIVLTIGILTACGSQPTEAPASMPTAAVVPATEAPTNPPADSPTSAPATEAPTAATSGQGSAVSFINDVLPLLESRCVSCHGGERTSEGLSLKSYAELMTGSNNGPVVTAGDANNSLIVELVATQKMPKRGPKLTPDQVQLLTDWINQGAQDN
ncbi:MAG: hypothetical protein QM730_15990 [Anaerolineales bacterium]